MLSRKIKRSGEEFIVEVLVDDKNAAVTDERGTRVTITYNSGHFNVRLPNGWGKLGTVYGTRREARSRALL